MLREKRVENIAPPSASFLMSGASLHPILKMGIIISVSHSFFVWFFFQESRTAQVKALAGGLAYRKHSIMAAPLLLLIQEAKLIGHPLPPALLCITL